ncbi:helix-turn-helix domain-containing protein [Pseudonocardia sp.]|uniref:helix-turn-helix domain-containing protein n=1 Tax=Pseudonocardia sp. TaxID=60912 RepID=UPI003D10E0D1
MTTPGPPPRLPDPGYSGPTVLRIVLGTQLRRMREANGVTREQAGDHIRASHAKISRLELGRVGFKERDIADLLTLYGVTDQRERDEFMDLVTQANAPGWWQHYGDMLPSWFEMYLRLEQAASVIRTFQVQFVPGLLQTEDYARSVIVAGHQGESVEDIDRRVQLRMTRQKLLTEPGSPRLWAVVDEAALRRPFGPPRVMRSQLDHLMRMVEMPNVSVQVLPFRFGGHAAAGGPFTILRFAEPDLPDIVYLEQLTSAVYLEKRSEVESYLAVMERVCVQAETPARSAEMLMRIRQDL